MLRIDLDKPFLMYVKDSPLRIGFVSDNLEELQDDEIFETAQQVMQESIDRRGLTAREGWAILAGVVDDPNWQQSLDPGVAARMKEQMASMPEAHVRVFLVVDIADIG